MVWFHRVLLPERMVGYIGRMRRPNGGVRQGACLHGQKRRRRIPAAPQNTEAVASAPHAAPDAAADG